MNTQNIITAVGMGKWTFPLKTSHCLHLLPTPMGVDNIDVGFNTEGTAISYPQWRLTLCHNKYKISQSKLPL